MIGKKIRELCEKSPYSQRELAKRLNISPPTLRRLFEMEQPDINLSLLQEISFVLNVPLSEFAEDLGVMQVVQKIDKEKNDPSGKEKDPKENELLQKIQSLETEIKRLQDALFQSQQETISILKK
ncbi:helix-turn-helix domain-containing protein, partial [Hugenholtzia roseola]|uniref:helix-turn-helix domain-containing protein n=1 Tax=Hugenholtzia roseola TaxID=1002 RepID=UPI000554A3F0